MKVTMHSHHTSSLLLSKELRSTHWPDNIYDTSDLRWMQQQFWRSVLRLTVRSSPADSVCLTTTLCSVRYLHLIVSVVLSNWTFRHKYFYSLLRLRIEFQPPSMLLYILILEDGTDMLCRNVNSKLSVYGVQQYRRQKISAKLAYMYRSQYNTTTVATTTTSNTTTTPTATTTTTTTTIFFV